MTYAHIFKRKGGGVTLVITRTPAITAENVIEEIACSNVTAAKAEARALGAKAWNY